MLHNVALTYLYFYSSVTFGESLQHCGQSTERDLAQYEMKLIVNFIETVSFHFRLYDIQPLQII